MFGFLYGPRFAGSLGVSSTSVSDQIEMSSMEIGNRIDELQLACAAMWELLREKNGVSDNELIEKIKEIDMRDGNPDGKMISPTEKCPECGHNLLIRARDVCSWCGALMKQSPFSN